MTLASGVFETLAWAVPTAMAAVMVLPWPLSKNRRGITIGSVIGLAVALVLTGLAVWIPWFEIPLWTGELTRFYIWGDADGYGKHIAPISFGINPVIGFLFGGVCAFVYEVGKKEAGEG
jgi:hypothetical protein